MVAREAGVAQSTVSLVVNNRPRVSEETRKRVLDAARRLRYVCEPRSGGMLIGVIITGCRAMNSYLAMTITAVKEEVHRRGCRLEIINSDDIELLNERVVAGAISLSNDPELNARWKELKNIPLVRFVSRGYPDSRADLRLIFDYLNRMGHRKIGLFLERTVAQERQFLDRTGELFRERLEAGGIAGAERLVSYAGTGTLPERLERLLSEGITALVVMPGDAALRIQGELARRNLRVPEDLSLLSREYSNVSEFMTPPTTTLLPDYPAMAAHALDLIEMFLQRKQPPGDIACPGRLLIRDSVRDLRNQNFTTG